MWRDKEGEKGKIRVAITRQLLNKKESEPEAKKAMMYIRRYSPH